MFKLKCLNYKKCNRRATFEVEYRNQFQQFCNKCFTEYKQAQLKPEEKLLRAIFGEENAPIWLPKRFKVRRCSHNWPVF